jgi:hypothetical protein
MIKHKNFDTNSEVMLMDETEIYPNHLKTVSPSQLQTRLEILRRESQLDCNNSKSSERSGGSGGNSSLSSNSNDKIKKSPPQTKCCLRCSCAIL